MGIQVCSGVVLKFSVCPICIFAETLSLVSMAYLLVETVFWGFKAKAALFSWQFLQHRSTWFSGTAASSFLSLSLFPLNWWMCLLFRKANSVRGKNWSNHPVPCTGRFLRIWLSVHLLSLSHLGFSKILDTGQINRPLLQCCTGLKNPQKSLCCFSHCIWSSSFLYSLWPGQKSISVNYLMRCFGVWWKRRKRMGWEVLKLDQFPIHSISPFV